ncbi:MAG: hypothetical protein WBW93_06805, partial [Steroidobacteraceae bacterium]
MRIARSASADSEIPICRASNWKRAFSSADGRAVIEGPDRRTLRSALSTALQGLVAYNLCSFFCSEVVHCRTGEMRLVTTIT